MILRSFRGFLYRLAKLLGDVLAAKKGRVGKRFALIGSDGIRDFVRQELSR